jgi:type II secretory pathway pseudopilin PulG
MRPPKKRTAGVALLEAIIALAVLSIAGLSTVALVDSTLKAQFEMHAREQQLATASRVLAAATLLHGPELDQRIGSREIGEFLLSVGRPEKRLYRLAISDVHVPEEDLLVTVVHKP